ncbi:MAG: hypothetical protein ACK40S_04375 [Burkholderiaceae bacterium]
MEFRLIYEGPLHGQGAKSSHKWDIRRALHPQLERLWQARPLADLAASLLAPPQPGGTSVLIEKGGLLFRQQPRGTLITDGGDLDNRLKTLLDGLRVPHGSLEGRKERPATPDPSPLFCLLEDDALVTKVSVESEQLLRPARPDEVVAIISVHVKKTVLHHRNLTL